MNLPRSEVSVNGLAFALLLRRRKKVQMLS
jgi:hypothetical protein